MCRTPQALRPGHSSFAPGRLSNVLIAPLEEVRERPQGRATSALCPSYHVETAATRDDMEAHRTAWELLAKSAAEPNVWYEPWLLFPAVDELGASVQFQFAFVYRTTPGPNPTRELCGVFPFEVTRESIWVPCRALKLWRHMFCFFGAPLIHRDHLADVWRAILDWAADSQPRPWWLDLTHQPVEGPLWHSLLDAASERHQAIYPVEQFHRARLVRGETFDRHCQFAMSAHCRQELRRKHRRLGELGNLELRVLGENDSIETWIEWFLSLEAQGWKGRETSALASALAQRSFFENLACGAFARHQLHLMGLFLDGRPVAMKCNLLALPGSFSSKIAFDESLAKYSPGVLLEWENTHWLLEQSEIEWMDSCANPGHFMIGQLWKHSRQLQRVLIPVRRRGDLALGKPYEDESNHDHATP